MGLAIDTGVMTVLTANAYLRSLLATDPDDGGPAIYYGSHDMLTAPVYPCLIFWEETATPDKRFFGMDVGDTTLCFQPWTQSLKAGDISQILDALKPMFKDTWFPLPLVAGPGGPATSGMFLSEEIGTRVPGMWDKKNQAFFGMDRYCIKTASTL